MLNDTFENRQLQNILLIPANNLSDSREFGANSLVKAKLPTYGLSWFLLIDLNHTVVNSVANSSRCRAGNSTVAFSAVFLYVASALRC